MHTDLQKSLEVLRGGGIILYPTDTIWGIGCDSTQPEAVKKVYQLKNRVDSKSMLVLVDLPARINSYVREVPEVAWDLIEYTTKPLTLILDGAKNLAPNLIADDGSVGIRVTSEAFSKELCARLKKPLVSTSANISGEPAPAHFGEIDKAILDGVDYVVQYRQDEREARVPSGIVKLGMNGTVKVIRE